MYKAVNKIKVFQKYMETLALYTGSPTVCWKYNTSHTSVVGDKRVTPIVKHVEIPVCFLLEQFYNGVFVPKYENPGGIPEYICTKPCSVPITSQGIKWITGFRLYPTSYIEHY